MPRPVTLFTGQWADLPLAELLPLVKKMGYDGVELACWGDHFEVDRALAEPDYCKKKWALLAKHGLKCFAISSHLVGQAVCDLIDERHKAILPADVWGDGKPEGVRQRAAEKMKATARAARESFSMPNPVRDNADNSPAVVNGFTGSSIWHSIYGFPPTNQDYWNKGFADFAKRWLPILDVFEKENVNFALEVHPTEIAFDIASAQRALDAVKNHPRFGFNYDPSHLGYQGVDYVKFIREFGPPHFPRAHEGRLVGPRRRHGRRVRRPHGFHRPAPLLGFPLARPRRHQVRGNHRRAERRRLSRPALGGMGGRPHGPRPRRDGSCAFVRKLDFTPNQAAFDAAFSKKK